MVSGKATVSFDTDANAMYYKPCAGKVARSRKLRHNGLDYVTDLDRKGEVVGVEVLNMKRALAASESALLLGPVRAVAAK